MMTFEELVARTEQASRDAEEAIARAASPEATVKDCQQAISAIARHAALKSHVARRLPKSAA